jgi:hypothetical protein
VHLVAVPAGEPPVGGELAVASPAIHVSPVEVLAAAPELRRFLLPGGSEGLRLVTAETEEIVFFPGLDPAAAGIGVQEEGPLA